MKQLRYQKVIIEIIKLAHLNHPLKKKFVSKSYFIFSSSEIIKNLI